MRILHISDVHVRNLKYHEDYRKVFANLYEKIKELKPDIVVNTGDSAHTKTQISPEFVQMLSDHIRKVSEICPYHIILGNHDLNLMNPDRQDAISPVVESIGNERVFLHKRSGRVEFAPGWNFWVFSLADRERYPLPADWAKFPDDVNIGLFHGSIQSCLTDSNWRMTHTEHSIDIFDGLDYALLGDIHKQQFLDDKRRIGYAGSLIQQNFGEDVDKGFLLWDIDDKEQHEVNSFFIEGSRKFFTVRLDESLIVPKMDIPEGSRIRISPSSTLTLVQQKAVQKVIRKLYKPHDIFTLPGNSMAFKRSTSKALDMENLRSLPFQEKLIENFLKERNLDQKIMDKVLELNRRYQIHVEQTDETARGIFWKINKITWDNFFNFGEKNSVDFNELAGLTGIFAPNASGKSNFIEILLETCFDSITKGISRNISLVNDNKDLASSRAEITAGDQDYVIERKIERIKYKQKNSEEVKEWGKTSCNFFTTDSTGAQENLNGTLRPETERAIRRKLGNFEDFMLTGLTAQWNPLDIIACKETKRKEILYKFLDLDVFDHKCLLARNESKEYHEKLHILEENGIEDAVKVQEEIRNRCRESILEKESTLAGLKERSQAAENKTLALALSKIQVDGVNDQSWIEEEIDRLEKEIMSLQQKTTESAEKQKVIEQQIAKIGKVEQKFELSTYESKAERLEEVKNDIEVWNRVLSSKIQSVSANKKNISILQEVPCGDQFPTCRFLVNAFEAKSKLPSMEKELAELRASIEALEKEKEELIPAADRLAEYRKFVAMKEGLVSKLDIGKLTIQNVELMLQSTIAERGRMSDELDRCLKATEDRKKNKELDAQIAALQTERAETDGLASTAQEQIRQLTMEQGAAQGILERISGQLEQLVELRTIVSAYEHYISAMGKDGIAYQILTQKLPIINEEINKILANAADFNIFIEHDNEEQSIRLYLQYGEYKQRLIELGSGAEKMLASIALRIALLNVSNLPKTNMFIIDEGFGKLDPKNLESVNRMFDYLKSVFDHVIVISHIDSMKDIVDNVIEIATDDEGYAHIEVG